VHGVGGGEAVGDERHARGARGGGGRVQRGRARGGERAALAARVRWARRAREVGDEDGRRKQRARLGARVNKARGVCKL